MRDLRDIGADRSARARRTASALAGLALAAALLVGCGSSGDGGGDATTTSAKVATTSTQAGGATAGAITGTTVSTSEPAGATTTAPANGLKPGDPCSLEEGSPDCIDPEDDGEGVYLIGGADCVANIPDPATCADLDGDGHAGYPDSQ